MSSHALSLGSSRAFLLALSLSASALPFLAGACSPASPDVDATSSAVRSVTKEEALADFDQLAGAFRSLYGALERKEARYGFRFDDVVAEYRARVATARDDAETQGLFQSFTARFRDAHISLQPAFPSDDMHAFRLPISVMPVEDKLVVYSVAPQFADRVKIGDELVSIGGDDPRSTVDAIAETYIGTPNKLASRHMAAARLTSRPAYLAAGLVDGSTSEIALRGADGQLRTVVLPWKEAARPLPTVASRKIPKAGTSTKATLMEVSTVAEEATQAELAKMGADLPFFLTDAVKAELAIERVAPSADALAKVGTTPDAVATLGYYAGRYELDGKKVLLVRIPSYMPEGDPNVSFLWFQALFQEQQPQVDALVVDQTHNPGGSVDFALNLASLLSPGAINGFVQKNHADRMWLENYLDLIGQITPTAPQEIVDLIRSQAHEIDVAYSTHQTHTAPMPAFDIPTVLPPVEGSWKKPMIMLIDELAVSCGDIVPSLMKANHVAPLFGETTMGGGGNVEEVATLTNTRWKLDLSRGLGTPFDPTGAYPDARFIEDNGVAPDVHYSHTVADFRAGYVGYVKAFNAELAKQLAAPPR